MMFLLIGLGVLAASAASWAKLLSDQSFSDAILQDGLLTFWWNSLAVLAEQPEFLFSVSSIAVPLLVAAIGPFVGISLAGMGVLALLKRPKEIEVQGKPRNPVRYAAKLMEEEKQKGFQTKQERDETASVETQTILEQKAFLKLSWLVKETEKTSPKKQLEPEFVLASITQKITETLAAIGEFLFGRISRFRRQVSKAPEQQATSRPVEAKQKEEVLEKGRQRTETTTTVEGAEQPLAERIMAWYAAWVTVRAGQRPPRMLEEARHLAAELDSKTRAAMTEFGMRGATALSMLESAAATGVPRNASDEEEEGFLPPPRRIGEEAADVEEFMREVEAPEAYGSTVGSTGSSIEQSIEPVVIEDDIPAPSPVEPAYGFSEEVTPGPMVIEDDISVPIVDQATRSKAEEQAAQQMMVGRSWKEVEIQIDESEFLPAPGTIDDGYGTVATTGTTGWEEVSVRPPSAPEVPQTQNEKDSAGPLTTEIAEAEAFLAEAEATYRDPKVTMGETDVQNGLERETPETMLEEVEQKETEAVATTAETGWPPFSAGSNPKTHLTETLNLKKEKETGESVTSQSPSPGEEKQDGSEVKTKGQNEARNWEASDTTQQAKTIVVKETKVASTESRSLIEISEADVREAPESFPSGVRPEEQEAVIGPLLADPERRARILGEREGTPTWTLRRLELYGLLGLSDKSNAAVVRMWEALDRLVTHQARVFAWENLKEKPPPEFETPEQRAAHVVMLAQEVIAERSRIGEDLLAEIRRLKAGTEHVAWMDDRVDSLLAAMTSPKVVEQLGEFFPKPEEKKAEAGGRLLKVLTGHREAEDVSILETPYEDLLAASHDIHQRYKEICKSLMVPVYRSLSVKVKEPDNRPVYAQIELVLGDVASNKQRSASPEGAIGIIFAVVPPGRWQIAEAAGRAGQDRLVLEGIGENAGRLVKLRDRSLEIFCRWVEGRNMKPFGVIHLLCGDGTTVEGIDRRWGEIEFVRNPWGQKDLEAIHKSRLRPRSG